MIAAMTPPPKTVPPYLRDMIDAAVAEGRVTRVPDGATSHPGYIWDARKGELARRVPIQKGARKRTSFYSVRAAATTIRRAEAEAMRAEGLTRQQIADRLGVSFWAVARLFKARPNGGRGDK